MATAMLLIIAVSPSKRDRAGRPIGNAARRVLMRGLLRAICPECCEIVHEDGLSTTLALDAATQIAGTPTAGDEVDVLARFTGSGYVALSIVRRA